MKSWIKYGLIGGVIWLILFLTFIISGQGHVCELMLNDLGELMEGIPCWSPIQHSVINLISIIAFPVFLLGGNANVSTVGPNGVTLFYVGSLICFMLWGILIGLIIGKIKSKKN